MEYTASNKRLSFRVSQTGAELMSLYDHVKSRELIWQGFPDVWAGRCPLLFPVVGKLKDDRYTVSEQSYTMVKHGFARRSDFTLSRQNGAILALTLTDTPSTRSCYPFAFRLTVAYALRGARLHILHTVYNPSSDETLPFSIGAHPGFNAALGDSIIFDKAEEPLAYRLGDDKLLAPKPERVPLDGNVLVLTKDLFIKDALIFQNPCSRSLTLHSKNAGDILKVDWYGAPVLGIWAKPGAPYVCVEPWHGIDDTTDVSGNLTEKPRVILLPPGESFQFPLTVTVCP